MTKHSMLSVLTLSSTLLLAACGGGSSSGKSSPTTQVNPVIEDYRGSFKATLAPMNMASPDIQGEYQLTLSDEIFQVQTTVFGAAPGARHFQYIINGKCQFNDQNEDGLVDMNEVFAQNGLILVPLDSNLDSQIEGSDFGPIANEEGKFVYKRSADGLRFIDDLMAGDPDPKDEFSKIREEKDLQLATRSIIVLGVDENTVLPETVASFRNLSLAESLPVACGEIQRSL